MEKDQEICGVFYNGLPLAFLILETSSKTNQHNFKTVSICNFKSFLNIYCLKGLIW